jgi:Xaa-Pro aminopeptidase
MRLIKDDGDWALGLRRAIDISARAHLEAMRSILPGKYEFEVQAVFEYVYRAMGSPRNGYPCIIGSGPNATILHYSTNTRQMKDGDLVLMDCAAEYGMYSADITRTVPVNGRFSKHQLDIYRIVLDAENAVIDYVMPGVTMAALDSVGNRVLADGLRRLGFVKDVKDHRVFTLYPFCHWVGLDVHDVGGYTRNGASVVLTPGMVFTVEPGIYVRAQAIDMLAQRGYTEEEIATVRSAVEPYLSIGVRIEDDVLVTAQGHQILSATAPRTPAEIESAMKERGVGKEQLR